MKAWIGKALMVIAVLHIIVGVTAYGPTLKALLDAGIVNTITISEHPDRGAAFWFLVSGFAFLVIGSLVDYLEKSELKIPLFVGISVAILTAIGITMMPVSGFWLLILPLAGLARMATMKKAGS